MQQNILAAHPGAKLRVYTVWFNMLWADSRDGWDSSVLPDPRVTHLWDQQHLVGRLFAAQDGDAGGIAWDGYWLYGPDARWDSAPGPLISAGQTVIDARADLQQAILPLLQP